MENKNYYIEQRYDIIKVAHIMDCSYGCALYKDMETKLFYKKKKSNVLKTTKKWSQIKDGQQILSSQ